MLSRAQAEAQRASLLPKPACLSDQVLVRTIHGVDVCVIPVPDLVQMKLSNNRDIDRVHVRDLDSVGLITSEVAATLPPVLRDRLEDIRNRE